MDDDKLKELFQNFNPELPSDSLFIARLRRSMNAVELVKERQAALRRKSRRAVAVAAVVGCLVGCMLTLICLWVGDCDFIVRLRIAGLTSEAIVVNYKAIGWGVIGIASVLTAMNAYEVALAKS